jgi:hypothetical protein
MNEVRVILSCRNEFDEPVGEDNWCDETSLQSFLIVFGELDSILVFDFLKLNHEMILNVLFEQRITNVCVLNL